MVKRLFIAVKVEKCHGLSQFVTQIRYDLEKEGIKWVEMGNMHISICFLGNIRPEKLQDISTALQSSAGRSNPFPLYIGGCGWFSDKSGPKVIWMGVKSEGLCQLHDEVTKSLKNTGIYTQKRTFRPHITLGRIKHLKNKNNLIQTLKKHDDKQICSLTVNEFLLYQSVLTPKGPQYSVLEKFRLHLCG